MESVHLYGRKWLAKGQPKAVIVAFHGISGHSGNYEEVGRVLSRQGVSLYAPDRWSSGLNRYVTRTELAGAADIEKKQDWIAHAESALRQVVEDETQLGHRPGIENNAIPLIVYANSWGARLTPTLLDSERHSPAGDVLRLVDGQYLSAPGLWTQKDETNVLQQLFGTITPAVSVKFDVKKGCVCKPKDRAQLGHTRYTFRFLGKSVELTHDSRRALKNLGRMQQTRAPGLGGPAFFLVLADDRADDRSSNGRRHEPLTDNLKTLKKIEETGLIRIDPAQNWARAEGACHFMEQEHPALVARLLMRFVESVRKGQQTWS